MRKGILAAAVLSLAGILTTSAQDFFSTEKSDRTFTFGARIGVNTSNRTMDRNAFGGYNVQNWGTGLDLGIVADINFRDYISIQPGVFFESRNGNYTIVDSFGSNSIMTQVGNRRSYNLTIPVVGSLHFNITDDIRWNVDLGPYVSFALSSKMKDKMVSFASDPADGMYAKSPIRAKAKGAEFGLKIGTGLQILDHYYVGAHYLAGFSDAWKDLEIDNVKYALGGMSKTWVFTLGYDF